LCVTAWFFKYSASKCKVDSHRYIVNQRVAEIGNEKCDDTLKDFLSNKDFRQLGRTFRPKPQWTTVSGLPFGIEVKKMGIGFRKA